MAADASNKAARLNAIAQANMADREREWNHAVYLEARDRDERLQKEFAQQGIQWRADDARRAGIHPLAAMGAQTMSFSSNVGTPQWSSPKVSPYAGASMGSAVAQAGQDISRAFQATRTEVQRQEAVNKTAQDLSLQRMGLENQLLASQIAKINQPATPPAFPSTQPRLIAGQGNSPLVKDEPLKRTLANPEAPSQEPAPVTDIGYTTTRTGYAPVYSKDAKDRLEEDEGGMLAWNLRNRLMPSFGLNYNIPGNARQGENNNYYFFNPFTQEYVKKTFRGRDPSRNRGYDNYMRIN